jgi:hypothetical protein
MLLDVCLRAALRSCDVGDQLEPLPFVRHVVEPVFTTDRLRNCAAKLAIDVRHDDSRARIRASASPRPIAAPVTIATLPSTLPMRSPRNQKPQKGNESAQR